MSFFSHGLFVVAGIIAGSTAINYFVLGNGADYGLPQFPPRRMAKQLHC
jgi:hypothetical protein